MTGLSNGIKNIRTFALMEGINKFPAEKQNNSLLDTVVQRTTSGYMGGCATAAISTAISTYRSAAIKALPSENLLKSTFRVAVQSGPAISELFVKSSFKGAAMGLGWALVGHAYKSLFPK